MNRGQPWDDRATALLTSLVVDNRKHGRTVVICSHQLREALEVATDVVVLDRGRVVFQGPNDEQLKSSPMSSTRESRD